MKILVTGGAGFLGSHLVRRGLERGDDVTVLDDLSRDGSAKRLGWLKRAARVRGGGQRLPQSLPLGSSAPLRFMRWDVRDPSKVRTAVREARPDLIVHCAAQVAVTTSVDDPRHDFDVNALGTLNVLEAARSAAKPPVVVFTSTNKVYGELEGVRIVRRGRRYALASLPHGVPETAPLDFHSPYGCSKGAADQYVRDYHRIYGLRTVVLRQSCIYGEWQFGNEDQGGVAHFAREALSRRPVTIYGDGRQVRDVLHADDFVSAVFGAAGAWRRTAGRVYNVGGGPGRTLSLLELVAWLEERLGRRMIVRRAGWRPGDQKVYVSDIGRAAREFGWRPRVSVEEGLERLLRWAGSEAGGHRS